MLRRVCLAVAGVLAVVGSALAQGPASHWRFDEAGGPTAADSAGTRPGTLFGDAAFAPGQGVAGGAIRLSGAGAVTMGDVFRFDQGQPYTLVVWIRTSAVTVQAPMGRHHTGFQNGYFIGVGTHGGVYGEPNKPHFYRSHSGGQEARSSTIVNDGQWHMLACVYDGSRPTIHVDGGGAPGIGVGRNAVANSAPFLVGGLWNGGSIVPYFTGLIDEAQVYDTNLDATAIQWLFDQPGAPLPGCYADCDQGTGRWTLDIFDFLCFQNEFAVSNPYACDCDLSTGPGVCDIFDFLCFQNAFANGCP